VPKVRHGIQDRPSARGSGRRRASGGWREHASDWGGRFWQVLDDGERFARFRQLLVLLMVFVLILLNQAGVEALAVHVLR
jgi:hypothetical protein